MLKKLILISLLLSSFGSVAFASIDQRSEDVVINSLYNQLEQAGYLYGISSSEKSTVIDIIKTEVENSFKRVQAGELSLDSNAANYFLLDTIGSIIKGVTKVVTSIGGTVFNVVKGALGTVVHAGLKFLSKIDNGFIKAVIGAGADALGVLIAGSGEALAAASLVIPVGGEIIAPILATLAPFATMVINSNTIGAASDLIAGAATKVLKLTDKEVEKGFPTKASLAPNPNVNFASLSKKASSSEPDVHEKFSTSFANICYGVMDHLRTLNADQYNKLNDKVKKAAAYCNHFAGTVNTIATK